MKENQVEIRNELLLTQDCGRKDHALGKWPGRKRALDVITSLRGRIGSIVWFALVFKLFRFLVLAPLGAVTLRVFLERWGRCSVGNFEVLAFLLSPPGLVALVAISAIALTSFYLEIGGLLLLLADQRATLGSAVTSLARHFIELKPGGPDDVAPLVNAVLNSVKAAGITDRCRLCSQSYESLQLARRIQPGIPVGFIAGAQLGELFKLDHKKNPTIRRSTPFALDRQCGISS